MDENIDPFIETMESFLKRPDVTNLQISCINMALIEYHHIKRSLQLIDEEKERINKRNVCFECSKP